MKICRDCTISKESNDFYYGRKVCKSCVNKRCNSYYITNKINILDKQKSIYKLNPELKKERSKSWRALNPDKKSENNKEYKSLNKNKINARRKDRLMNDLSFKLSCYLRTRMNRAIAKNSKGGSAVKDLGCTIDFLKSHLEAQFQPGMSWDNYGKWHIDHIIPLSSFNLLNREEFLKACNFSNLQPLWAKDNLSKGDKVYVSTCGA